MTILRLPCDRLKNMVRRSLGGCFGTSGMCEREDKQSFSWVGGNQYFAITALRHDPSIVLEIEGAA